MALKLYKMTFKNAHFGEGQLNESHPTFDASRLYSALFLEALKIGKMDEFLQLTQKTSFVLSDAFPYINKTPFLPKPIGYPKPIEETITNIKKARQEAKKAKKLSFIPFDEMKNYLNFESDIHKLSSYRSKLNSTDTVTKKGADPYEVGVTRFKAALYVIATQSTLFDTLFDSLQYSGLGGKRSSGYGQFFLEVLEMPEKLKTTVSRNVSSLSMLLTTSLPQEQELEKSVENAYYLLKKTSGFAYSETTGDLLRKQDLYKFKAGSTFQYSYEGSIVDVRPDNFPHPVWNYAKGL